MSNVADRQTDRQTNPTPADHNLLGGGNAIQMVWHQIGYSDR